MAMKKPRLKAMGSWDSLLEEMHNRAAPWELHNNIAVRVLGESTQRTLSPVSLILCGIHMLP